MISKSLIYNVKSKMLLTLIIPCMLPLVVLCKLGCPSPSPSPSLELGTWVHKQSLGKCYVAMPGAEGSCDEAEAWCRQHGGHLATPRDDSQLEAISSTAIQIHGHDMLIYLWIGIDNLEHRGQLQFADGQSVKGRSLILRGKHNVNKHYCIALKPGEKKYIALNCWERNHFLCETSNMAFVDNDTMYTQRCPPGWLYFPRAGYCYTISQHKVARPSNVHSFGSDFCDQQGGNIAMPRTRRQLRAVRVMIEQSKQLQTSNPRNPSNPSNSSNAGLEIWIGLRKYPSRPLKFWKGLTKYPSSALKYIWADGKIQTWINWLNHRKDKELDQTGGQLTNKDCLAMTSSGDVRRRACSDLKHVVCEMRQTSAEHRVYRDIQSTSARSKTNPKVRSLTSADRSSRYFFLKDNGGKRAKASSRNTRESDPSRNTRESDPSRSTRENALHLDKVVVCGPTEVGAVVAVTCSMLGSPRDFTVNFKRKSVQTSMNIIACSGGRCKYDIQEYGIELQTTNETVEIVVFVKTLERANGNLTCCAGSLSRGGLSTSGGAGGLSDGGLSTSGGGGGLSDAGLSTEDNCVDACSIHAYTVPAQPLLEVSMYNTTHLQASARAVGVYPGAKCVFYVINLAANCSCGKPQGDAERLLPYEDITVEHTLDNAQLADDVISVHSADDSLTVRCKILVPIAVLSLERAAFKVIMYPSVFPDPPSDHTTSAITNSSNFDFDAKSQNECDSPLVVGETKAFTCTTSTPDIEWTFGVCSQHIRCTANGSCYPDVDMFKATMSRSGRYWTSVLTVTAERDTDRRQAIECGDREGCVMSCVLEVVDKPGATTATVPLLCPPSFVQLSAWCYTFHPGVRLQFKAAVALCSARGADVLSLESRRKQDDVTQYLDLNHPGVGEWRMGAYKLHGVYTWCRGCDLHPMTSPAAKVTYWPGSEVTAGSALTLRRGDNATWGWSGGGMDGRHAVVCQTEARPREYDSEAADSSAEQPSHASLVELLIWTILTWAVGRVAADHGDTKQMKHKKRKN